MLHKQTTVNQGNYAVKQAWRCYDIVFDSKKRGVKEK